MEVSKDSLEILSDVRIKEALLLLNNSLYSGAYYIAGYSVELAIKACIAKNFRSLVLPDKSFVNNIHTHDLEKLMGLAGLKEALTKERNVNTELDTNWLIVKDWSEEARYVEWDSIHASSLYNAITDRQNGVLQWLKKYY